MLTDHQMAVLDRFYPKRLAAERRGSLTGAEGRARMRQAADRETREKQEIRDVLGEARYERHLAYMDSLGERQEVAHFEERVNDPDKLTPEQRRRLVELLRATRDQHSARRFGHSELHTKNWQILASEDDFRQMQEASRALLRRLRSVLSARQLEEYSRMEASTLESERAHVQELRVRAGMSPEFDETAPPARSVKRGLTAGKVRLQIEFTVDAHPPMIVDAVADNGRSLPAFQAPEGLWIEATPTLYEDGCAVVDFIYDEERGGKRHRMSYRSSHRSDARGPDGQPSGGGGGGTLGTSRKTVVLNYWITVSAVK